MVAIFTSSLDPLKRYGVSDNIWDLGILFFITDHFILWKVIDKSICFFLSSVGLSVCHEVAFPGVHSSRHEDFADCREVPAVAADLRWFALYVFEIQKTPWERKFLLETITFRVHVSFRWCRF